MEGETMNEMTRGDVMDNDKLFNKCLDVGSMLNKRVEGFTGEGHALMIAIDYATVFGDEGLDDLRGYVAYATAGKLSKLRIGATLGHDINGMNDRCFVPRTKGYAKHLNSGGDAITKS
jgi:hypothetical protein